MNLSRMNRRRFSKAVTFGDVQYPPGGTLGPRVQQDVQLVVLLEGQVTIEVEAVEYLLLERQAMLMLPGRTERYSFAPDRESRHTWCAVTLEVLPEDLLESLEPLSRPFALTPRIEAFLDHGLGLPSSALPEADAVLEGLALLILRSLLFEVAVGASEDRQPRALRKARAFMEAHLSEPLDLTRLAGAVHVSPQHLTRLFRVHLEVTPMRYLWRLRTERGAALLRETGLSVARIAEQVGFGSPFHFSRLVRQMYGQSPSALRRDSWTPENT